jgi:hypothetical protein
MRHQAQEIDHPVRPERDGQGRGQAETLARLGHFRFLRLPRGDRAFKLL